MAGSKDNATSVESLETADHLTDFSKMREAYDQLCQEEEVINMDLGGLLEHQALLETKMVSLHKMLPNLQILETDSKQLSSMIAFTSTLAENVSSKVRQLDLAKSRVSTCIQRVEDVLDLKFCTDGVQSALQNEDYETAAGHIHRFLSLDENILRMAADASEGSALDTSFKLLHEAEEKMKTIVRKKFDASVHTADVASVERFFKIFPLLGLHDEGLAKFGKYLAAQISETADKTMKQTHEDEKRAKVKFADSITVLFERIARVVEIHQPLVETFYGPGKLVMLLYTLQKECDRQARKIMERFRNARDLDHKIQQVQQSLSYTKFSSDRLDPKELDVLLSEMVLLNTRAELYLRFIKRRALNDIELGYQDEAKNDKSSEVKSFLNNCDLSRLMQELIGNYILMEEYFMREMVVKAVNMDTMEGGAQTSSMVDDSFYIVKKSVRRAISSSSVDGVCAMLNHAATIFEQDFREVLFSRLRPGFPSGFDLTQAYNLVQSSLQQGKLQSSDTEKAKATFLITLNNAEVSCDYIKSLKSSLQQELANIYNQCNEQDQAKLETCLTDLGSVSVQFKDVVEFGFNQLYSSSIKPRIKPLVDVLLSTVHNITEDEFANYEANDPWMQNFIMNLDGMLANFKQGLTTANYDKYVGFTTNEITVQLEKAVLKITFNRLGGLQFDKELRALVSYLTSVTTWTVRDKFARLTQMATILNLERVMEILDYWGPNSGPLTWRLTPTEVRQILSLRIDFRNEDIKRLKL